jgi:hypothetical protein
MPTTRRELLAVLGTFMFTATGAGSLLLAGHGGHVCCPDCGHKVCQPTPAIIKEKKTAYQCDCKDICIPGIKGPFAACSEPPKCGRVRTIKVLRKIEYECEKCGYQWNVKGVSCDCCK